MPGVVPLARPTVVLPLSLSTAFTRGHEYASLVNTYPDGSSQREILVDNDRRRWQLSKRLTPTKMVELRTFYETYRVTPFYFYDPFQASDNEPIVPVGNNYDPTGASTTGRYAVRFEGAWSQSTGIGRGDVSIELVELAEGAAGGELDFREPETSAHIATVL